MLTVPDYPMYRVPRLGEHSGCGSCGRQVAMRRMYNRHTIYIRVTCSHIHSIPVQELYSCTHWTYVPSIGKPTYPTTPHTLLPCPHGTYSLSQLLQIINFKFADYVELSNPFNQYLEKFGKICMKILQQFCKNKKYTEELLKVLQRKVK